MARTPVKTKEENNDFIDRLVHINRVAKVVKGGRRFGFAALVVKVPLRDGRTLHHDVYGHHGSGKVLLRSAPSGTGIIAGGPMRAIFEAVGVQDVVAKSQGTANPYNMVRATFNALKSEQSPRMVAARRGMKVSNLVSRRKELATEIDDR